MSNRVCSHSHLILFGSEETGLRAIQCKLCGVAMTRTRDPRDGEYVYYPMLVVTR